MSKVSKEIDDALKELDSASSVSTYLSDKSLSSEVNDWIDTGSLVFNSIISGRTDGGIPKGRVTLLAGESKVGKTLFILKILANAQKKGLIPVIFDTENAIDPSSAARFGIDLDKVKYVSCESIEQTTVSLFNFLNKVKETPKLHGKFIVAIDSLGNTLSELEIKRLGKKNTAIDMGSAARATKLLMKTCTVYGGLTNTTVVCSNHIYDNPAEMFPSLEKSMTGGKSVIYLPSLTVQLARKPVDARKLENKSKFDAELKTSQKTYSGIIIRALTVKNRMITQYLEGEMYLSFSTGLNKYYGLLDLAKGLDIIIQSGATYSLQDGTKLGYYKSFKDDKELWDKTIIPQLNEKMLKEWSYSSMSDDYDIIDEEAPDEVEDE